MGVGCLGVSAGVKEVGCRCFVVSWGEGECVCECRVFWCGC